MLLPDWSTLPTDSIEDISSRITDDTDYAHFRSVCTSWHSAAPIRPKHPWMLVLYNKEVDTVGARLYNFTNTKLSNPPLLPEGLTRARFINSSRGWIALDNPPGISLHNPFTRAHIRLPPLTDLSRINKSFQSYYPEKIVLSSDPLISASLVLAITHNGERLMYCQPGDHTWTPFPFVIDDLDRLNDIIFYKGKFYAVCNYRVFVCDIVTDYAQVTEILQADPLFSDGFSRDHIYNDKYHYLVVSSGDLLLVAVTYPDCYCGRPDCEYCVDFFIEVFRVDLEFSEEFICQFKLFKMDNLGGCSLFLGRHSMSVSVGTSPWCRGNCIYYVHRWSEKIIVYSMEDDNISLITGFSDDQIQSWDFHWFSPSICI